MGGFDSIDGEILKLKIMFLRASKFQETLIWEAFAQFAFNFLLELFFLSFCDRIGHMFKNLHNISNWRTYTKKIQ